MSQQPFSNGIDIPDLFSESLTVFRAHVWKYIVASVVVLGLQSATSYFYFAGLLLMGPLLMGLFKMALAGVRNQEVLLGDAFCGFDYFLQAVYLSLIVLVAPLLIPTFLSFIHFYVLSFLLTLPALYFGIPYLTGYFFLLEGTVSTNEVLSRSRALRNTDYVTWRWISGYCVALLVLGSLFFGLGLCITLPIVAISLAIVYDRSFPDPKRPAVVETPHEELP